MAKAIEIRFSVPTVIAANPVVSSSPTTRVRAMASISRQRRTAANSHTSTSRKLAPRPTAAPWATVANSSSSNAIDPVTRTRASPAFT
jgi:histone deacetylase complex regulatory component SIN3